MNVRDDQWSTPTEEFGFRAAIVEWQGYWKMMAEVVGLPSWAHKDGICWRCNVTNDRPRNREPP
eukprot:275976-Amphidinium_carterae.1